ncbi:hypothetical protein [Carboxylicivirga linearis]|uniref:Lipoprotein n=1 Tax=Carboxylicivirga linearis TaxID=1628157 RepID=A0ABS5JV52_9BACT|nr:hypothetical protein [Carboxylicivirga linearis]MBS2098777.1 hypothetical protein [Carboxylicivirga linearis]
MKKLLFILAVMLVGCKSIFNPIFSAIVKYQQSDTCNKVLIAKVIDYRTTQGMFPLAADCLNSSINYNELEIARQMMWLPDSLISDSSIIRFEETWNQSCPKQFDSISFTSYQTDSIDIFTNLIFRNDTSYSVLKERRRLLFTNDTFSKLSHYIIDVHSFDNNGEPIDLIYKRKSSKK